MPSDLLDIKELLRGRIESLCQKLLPGGHREGRLWVAHNPLVDEGRKAPAFKVALTGAKGAWKDWRSGDKGDVIDLIAYVERCDRRQALAWARDYLGLQRMSREERLAFRAKAKAQAAARQHGEAQERAHRLQRAQQLFHDAGPPPNWTRPPPAQVHAMAYFEGRGCGLLEVSTLNPESFRFSPSSEYWKGAQWKHKDGRLQKVAKGPLFPAVHAAMRTATGIVTACHVTFLDPSEPKKAPVEPPKLMFGEALGAVIELATGPSLLPFWQAQAPGIVILCEGIETGLSIAKAVADARVWACGSLAGLANAPVGLATVGEIIVARDNNVGNVQAQQQLAACLARLDQANKPIVVMSSHVGDDFNDLMQGGSNE